MKTKYIHVKITEEMQDKIQKWAVDNAPSGEDRVNISAMIRSYLEKVISK